MQQGKSNTDHELILGLIKGDYDCFQTIFEHYSKPLFTFSYSYLKSKEAAEGLVQEVFMKIWKNRKKLKS